MININKYATLNDYLGDQNITSTECRVSQIGPSAGLHIRYDLPNGMAENIVLPVSRIGVDDICVVVKDKLDGKIKYIPQAYFRADKLDQNIYEIKPYIRYHGEGRNQYMLHKSATSGKWGRNNYYKLYISGLTSSTDTIDSSLIGETVGFTIVINRTSRTVSTTYESGDTLSTIASRLYNANPVTKFTDKDQSGTGIYIGYINTEGFIRVSTSSYSHDAAVATGTGATIEDLSKKLQYKNSVPADYTTEVHHTWHAQYLQSMLPASIVSELRTAYNGATNLYSQTAYCRHGESMGYMAGANYYIYNYYYSDSNGGTDVTKAFTANTSPLNSATFSGWQQTEFATYKDYLVARMVDTESNKGVNALSYDNGQQVSSILASVMTQDFDGTWVSAFPAAYNAIQYSDPDLGTCGLPTVHEIGLFMCDERPNRFSKIKSGITALGGGSALSNGTYCWSSVESNSGGAWCYYCNRGTLGSDSKYDTLTVRPALVYAV